MVRGFVGLGIGPGLGQGGGRYNPGGLTHESLPVTFRTRLSAVPSWLALCAAGFLLAGCSSTKTDPTANWSPNKIYSEAKDEADGGAYDKAVPLFEKLEGRAAGTPLAQQAQIDKAYAQYRAGDKAQALATLDRFMKLHPASPAIDYALYLKGTINFNDDLGMFAWLTRQDLSERDQKAAKESFESFRELVTRFPDSRYANDARQRMNYIVNSLAQYEVHVARYYYKRGAYLAAINRAQIALADYREVPALEEALYIMVLSYDALGMNDLRDDTKRVLTTNYPQSRYLAQGFKTKDDPWWKLW
ncbi:MAG: outer membrane protein assembly factor BamD [Pseudacidovorax sp.]|nr:outer membrane protein assembly factor BamD [Pseudacidovorax sp.]